MLTLNRPDKLNALTVGVFEELRGHITDLRDDGSVGCVVLRGAGRCFSAGHDLADIAAGEHVPSPGWHSETLRMLERLSAPVVAAVHGHCYTGALEVALAADFIVAADDARFGDTHAKFALTPIWGMSQRLPRRVGAATAKRLMFTADVIDATRPSRSAWSSRRTSRTSRGRAGGVHHRELRLLARRGQAPPGGHRLRPARSTPVFGGKSWRTRGRAPTRTSGSTPSAAGTVDSSTHVDPGTGPELHAFAEEAAGFWNGADRRDPRGRQRDHRGRLVRHHDGPIRMLYRTG